MRSISVKELKDDVGRYLDEVLAGEEVVIEDRNKPVAKIIPFGANGESTSELDSPAIKPVAKRKVRSSQKLPPLEEDPLYITDEELEAHEAKLVAEGKMRLPLVEGPHFLGIEAISEVQGALSSVGSKHAWSPKEKCVCR